jgi:Ca2+-binding RTX toxin-like protein
MIEQLEPRKLFAVTLTSGVLTITGTGQDDYISVYSPQSFIEGQTTVNVKTFRTRAGATQVIRASKEIFRFNAADIDSIIIDTRGGDDRVDLLPYATPHPTDLRTGAGDDVVHGTVHATLIAHLGSGDDLLDQGPGASTGKYRAFGQDGNDTLIGTGSADILDGGEGNDRITGKTGGASGDTIRGGNGDDFLEGDGESGNGEGDLVFGDAGNDTLHGNRGNDTLEGGAGNDILDGFQGNDHLYGGDGDDDLRGHSGSDGLYGDAGNDDVFADTSLLYDQSPQDVGDNTTISTT